MRWPLTLDRYAPMDWIENLADYRDFYSYVFLCAPDDFPEEDFLSDEEQMNLEKAFELLIFNLQLVCSTVGEEAVPKLRSKLSESRSAFRNGDSDLGLQLLREVQFSIWPPLGA